MIRRRLDHRAGFGSSHHVVAPSGTKCPRSIKSPMAERTSSGLMPIVCASASTLPLNSIDRDGFGVFVIMVLCPNATMIAMIWGGAASIARADGGRPKLKGRHRLAISDGPTERTHFTEPDDCRRLV
jgi:hypothetical protein